MPVASGPGDKRKDDAESSAEGRKQAAAQRRRRARIPVPRDADQGRKDRHREQSLLRAKKERGGKRKADAKDPAIEEMGAAAPTIEAEPGEGDAREGKGLSERRGGVVSGEGAERRESEADEGSAVAEEAAGKRGKAKACEEIEGDLQPEHGGEVAHAEQEEAAGKKERVAGQADQRRGKGRRRRGEAVDVVGEKVSGDVAVDLRIPGEGVGVAEKPEPKEQACRKQRDGGVPDATIAERHSKDDKPEGGETRTAARRAAAARIPFEPQHAPKMSPEDNDEASLLRSAT